MIAPHGGTLKNRMIPQERVEQEIALCKALPVLRMTSREVSDFLMIANGSFSPLEGFMTQKDYLSVIQKGRLAEGILFPLPVTLAVTEQEAAALRPGQWAALYGDQDGILYGRILIEEIYEYDKKQEILSSFGTDDPEHPGVAKTLAQKERYVGGRIDAFTKGAYAEEYPEYGEPDMTRALIREKGWKTVAAFQTRNPMHRSHEYLTKIALEICDGLLIHPVVGALKQGDLPGDVRIQCYRALIDRYYPENRVILKVYPMEMRYAGPKEAVLHAIIRQNYGCTHMIIGRDHAGVGSYYGPFDAQDIFDSLQPGDLQIQPLKIDLTFWCNACGGVASAKTCPHSESEHLMISGTDLRRMLSQGVRPPETVTRPEVADLLIHYYGNKK